MDRDNLMSVKQAATRLQCSVPFLRKWIREGRISAVRIGRLVRLRQEDVDAWIRVGFKP
jgi:excisionase family DNA binding protein